MSRSFIQPLGMLALESRSTPRFRGRGVVAVWGCVLFLGCAPSLEGNEPREPNKEVPGDFKVKGASEDPGSSVETRSLAEKTWGEFFADEHLRALIEVALSENQELRIRQQEIIIASSEVIEKKGEYLPKVDAYAGAGVEKVGRETSQGVSDEAHGVAENLGDFRFGMAASWEIDVWKKLRNAKKAAALRYLSSIAGRDFLVTQLVAEIANSYYELIALDQRLDVLKNNIAIQKDALRVVRLEKQAARVTQLAVQRFEAEVLKNRSRQFDLEQQRIEAQNRINFLLGRFPQPIVRSATGLDVPLPGAVTTGVPAALLDHRPDVRRAELLLEAAELDKKAAKASFYPSLSIEAGVGYESFNAAHLLFTPESLAYGLAGGLTAPLINRSALKAQYRTKNAQQVQAVYEYERTLLHAFTEVQNQLSRIKNLRRSFELESAQVDTLKQSIEVSNVLFQSARADYMEVLLTRRDSLDAEMELIETKLRQMQALVAVYQALGGGWR